MIYATVEFPVAGQPDAKLHADLADAGWKVRGNGTSAFDALINSFASPDAFGPADGDPVARAAAKAAELLSGVVIYVREPDPVPFDAVF